MKKKELSTLITDRKLVDYQDLLDLSNTDIEEADNIHIVWAWWSNIEKDLKQKWIHDKTVIHSDLIFNAEVKLFLWIPKSIKQKIDKIFWDNINQERTFVQNDIRKQGFLDDSFDITLALWMFHQIPEEDKENSLKEMMRTSKKVHIWPIYKSDFEIIKNMCDDNWFEVTSFKRTKYWIWSYLRSKFGVWEIYQKYRLFKAKILSTIQEEKFDESVDFIEFPNDNKDNNIYLGNKVIFTKQWEAYTCILSKKR